MNVNISHVFIICINVLLLNMLSCVCVCIHKCM